MRFKIFKIRKIRIHIVNTVNREFPVAITPRAPHTPIYTHTTIPSHVPGYAHACTRYTRYTRRLYLYYSQRRHSTASCQGGGRSRGERLMECAGAAGEAEGRGGGGVFNRIIFCYIYNIGTLLNKFFKFSFLNRLTWLIKW
jgi:hypothetical protein